MGVSFNLNYHLSYFLFFFNQELRVLLALRPRVPNFTPIRQDAIQIQLIAPCRPTMEICAPTTANI